MPLVRISLYEATPISDRKAIADAVYESMRETIGIPEGDRFIVVAAHPNEELFIDPAYMNVKRSDRFILVQIFLSKGRTVEQKLALYQSIGTRLNESIKVSTDDVMTVLTENTYLDWSFGKGEGQYILNPPAWASRSAEGN